jgi:hypothetical protein
VYELARVGLCVGTTAYWGVGCWTCLRVGRDMRPKGED